MSKNDDQAGLKDMLSLAQEAVDLLGSSGQEDPRTPASLVLPSTQPSSDHFLKQNEMLST